MSKGLTRAFALSLLSVACVCTASPHQPAYEFQPAHYRDLPGWGKDNLSEAFKAFRISCQRLITHHNQTLSSSALKLNSVQWTKVCQIAVGMHHVDDAKARQFFQHYFRPVAVHSKSHHDSGLFTGYYLPSLKAYAHPTGRYSAPLYTRPSNLVAADLGKFQHHLTGNSIVGQLHQHELVPFPFTRSMINRGALNPYCKVIAWVDPVDRFFLQIQGSGAIHFDNGKTMLLGYAGKNGHPFTPISRAMVKNGLLKKNQLSMQKIRDWLKHHPRQAQSLMNTNESFVFFKVLPGTAPLGTERTPLTPQRSLAVDNRIIPLGVPIWLSTRVPNKNNLAKEQPWHRLMVTQDTGGAIRGAVRGDIYWGGGKEAELLAGHMKSAGKYWLLLPRT